MIDTMLSIPSSTQTLHTSAAVARPATNRTAIDRAAQSDLQVPASTAGSTTDAEIAQLVSHALESALKALGETDRETFINLRAYEMRMGMRKVFESLSRRQATDPTVVKEYRRSIMFQNVTLDLALNIADAIERYAKTRDQEASSGEY